MWSLKTFSQIKEHLSNLDELKLPGNHAHQLLAPPGRVTNLPPSIDIADVKRAAVLMLIVDSNDRPELILTKRKVYKGVHSGQISLPGGKREESDRNYQHTALRETEEEIGIPSSKIEVLAQLSELYIPPSNFLVQPFLGIMEEQTEFIAEESEVEQIIPVDLNQLFHPDTRGEHYVDARGHRIKVPAYKVDDHIIWGATAMMISELKELLH